VAVTVAIITSANQELLERVAPGVFDREIDAGLCREFVSDPRHHLAVAVDEGLVIGMASGVHYVHPDKPPQLWINEVAVAPTHQGRGVGTQLLVALLKVGSEVGCTEAWVLTDRTNAPAMKLYAGCGGIEAQRDQVMFTFKLG